MNKELFDLSSLTVTELYKLHNSVTLALLGRLWPLWILTGALLIILAIVWWKS
jgi:hypothetical protein